jgi:hypothetical protein
MFEISAIRALRPMDGFSESFQVRSLSSWAEIAG